MYIGYLVIKRTRTTYNYNNIRNNKICIRKYFNIIVWFTKSTVTIFNVDAYDDTLRHYIFFPVCYIDVHKSFCYNCLQAFKFYLDFLALNGNFFIDFPANDRNNLLVNVFTTFLKTNRILIVFAQIFRFPGLLDSFTIKYILSPYIRLVQLATYATVAVRSESSNLI